MPKGNKQSTVFNKVFRSVTADMEGGRGGRSGRGGIGQSCRSGEARRRSGGDYCDCGGGNSSPEVEELEPALLADRRVGHGPGCGPATGTTSGDSSAPGGAGAATSQHGAFSCFCVQRETMNTTNDPSYMALSGTVHASDDLL